MNFLKSAKNLASKLFIAPPTNSSKTEALPPETVEPQQTATETFHEAEVFSEQTSTALVVHAGAVDLGSEPEPAVGSAEDAAALESQVRVKEHSLAQLELEARKFTSVLEQLAGDLAYQERLAQTEYLHLCALNEVEPQDDGHRSMRAEQENKPQFNSAKADQDSRVLFRKIAAKVHPDKSDPRYAGMFERACALRKAQDVAGLESLLESVAQIAKAGSYLLVRLQELRRRSAELDAQIQQVANSNLFILRNHYNQGHIEAVKMYERERRMKSILNYRSLTAQLRARLDQQQTTAP